MCLLPFGVRRRELEVGPRQSVRNDKALEMFCQGRHRLCKNPSGTSVQLRETTNHECQLQSTAPGSTGWKKRKLSLKGQPSRHQVPGERKAPSGTRGRAEGATRGALASIPAPPLTSCTNVSTGSLRNPSTNLYTAGIRPQGLSVPLLAVKL